MRLISVGVLVATVALVSLASRSISGQTGAATAKAPATAKSYVPPRTADGQPDLQGVWGYATITPLERPAEFADKPVLSQEEAVQLERRTAEIQNRDRRDHADTAERGSDGRTDLDRAYNEFWWDKGKNVVGTKQTSLIVDPPDGKIPPLTAAGQQRTAALRGLQTASARRGTDWPHLRLLRRSSARRAVPVVGRCRTADGTGSL